MICKGMSLDPSSHVEASDSITGGGAETGELMGLAKLAKTMGALGSVRDPALKVEGDRNGQLTPYFGFHVYASIHTYICTHQNNI